MAMITQKRETGKRAVTVTKLNHAKQHLNVSKERVGVAVAPAVRAKTVEHVTFAKT